MPLSLRLPDDIDQRLSALAGRTGRTKTFYATEAIREHLSDLEDWYAADSVARAVREGRETTRSLDAVMAEHGLDD